MSVNTNMIAVSYDRYGEAGVVINIGVVFDLDSLSTPAISRTILQVGEHNTVSSPDQFIQNIQNMLF